MVGIAQLVEHLVVVQGVAGSSPVTHPKKCLMVPEINSGTIIYWGLLIRHLNQQLAHASSIGRTFHRLHHCANDCTGSLHASFANGI